MHPHYIPHTLHTAHNAHSTQCTQHTIVSDLNVTITDNDQWEITVKKSAKKWLQHVKTWLTARGTSTLVIEYNDLKMDRFGQLKRMLDFIGHPYTDDDILCAAKPSSTDSFHRNHTKQFLGLRDLL